MTTALKPGQWQYPYVPTARQLALHDCDAQEILYGGASGGGKSDALIATGVSFCLAIPGARVFLFRRTYKMLELEIIPRMLARIPEHVARYRAQDHVFEFSNGATFRLGYLATRADLMNYQGVEITLALFDELTQFDRYQYVYIRSRLRMAGAVADAMRVRRWVPRIISTSNPGGLGHGWTKRMYVDPSPGADVPFWGGTEPGESERGKRWMCYIPAKATDNPYLDIRAYMRQLEGLDPVLRRAYMDGDWDILEGVRFSQFRRAVHVIDPRDLPIPMIGYPRAVGVDYGLQAPFAAVWGALLPDGLVVVYRELYAPNLTAEQQARLIVEAEADGERTVGRPIPVALDPSCWSRAADQTEHQVDRSMPAVGSVAWWYRKHLGGSVRKAQNDRIPGWQLVDHGLRIREDGLPRLLIYSTCVNLIRTLPELQRSLGNPEDIAGGGSGGKQEDHACFPAGTLVRTATGDRPIESIRPGDLVLTRRGLRPVLAAGCTAVDAEVGTVRFDNGRTLTGTPDHPVYVQVKGMIALRCLSEKDIIETCPPRSPGSKSLSTKGSRFAGILTRLTGTAASTTTPAAPTGVAAWASSIKRSGKTTTGRSRSATSSTTSTMIHSTTTPPTWRPSLRPSTWLTTALTDGPRLGLGSSSVDTAGKRSRRASRTPFGIAVAPAGEPHGGPPPLPHSRTNGTVQDAARSSRPSTLAELDGAPTGAGGRRFGTPGWRRNSGSASTAGRRSGLISTARRGPAPVSVVQPYEAAGRAPAVFNLTVEGEHEYYANGILVSNCDALRYLLFQLVGGGHDRTAPDAGGRYVGEVDAAARRQDLTYDVIRPDAPRPGARHDVSRRPPQRVDRRDGWTDS